MPSAKLIFMGTPDFAVPALRALAARRDVDIALVVTQPDRPAGRGKKLMAPPVKDAAVDLQLPLLQSDSLRHAEVRQRIIDIQPDLVVVAAFGMILGKWILELPRLGCVNLHASLLPKYRGASPIPAAILAGEEETGVTLMQMDRGLDTGDMLADIRVPIAADDTTDSLTPKLATAAAELLDFRLADLLAEELTPQLQPEGATVTRQLTKDDGRIDWSQSALSIERQVRAMWSWPRAWTTLDDGTRFQIHGASVVAGDPLHPGTIHLTEQAVVVGTGSDQLQITRAQFPGGKPIEGNSLRQKFGSFGEQRVGQ